ncbi:MAG: lipopolysaccharide heptosyltransferase II [Betaproteobacteria bacterium]|nr:lipopolysaccharide heptosyltransferase II [Betaproteobacteria bacterium]
MKILVVGPSWVGDTVLAQPLFQRLHERHGSLTLDVLGPPWTLPLLKRMPQVNAALANPFGHGELALVKRWKIGRSLRAGLYDQAIVLPNSLKSAIVPWAARIERRTGFVGEMRHGLLNDARVLDKRALPLMVERFVALAGEEFGEPKALAPLHLRVSGENQRKVLSRLNLDTERPIACLCPGAEYGPAKRWPAEHFASLARELSQRGFQVWSLGSGKDSDTGARIERLSEGGARNLCGQTGLDDAIDLLALARLVVSNDSGLMHVAAALHRPLIALYGSSSPAFTPPLSPHAVVVKEDIECSPCFKRECPLGHFRCMKMLTAQSLIPHIARMTA